MIRKYRTPEQFAHPEAKKHVYTQEELTELIDVGIAEYIECEADQIAAFKKFAFDHEISKRINDNDAVRRRFWGMACRYKKSQKWIPVKRDKPVKTGPWSWGEIDALKRRVECKSFEALPFCQQYYAAFFNRTEEDVIDMWRHLQNDGREGLIFH